MEKRRLIAKGESTCLSGERPVRRSAPPENARGWREHRALLSTMLASLGKYGLRGSSGRMSKDRLRVPHTATSATSTFFSTPLRRAGILRWDADGTCAGVCSIPNMSEWNSIPERSRSGGSVSSLSDVLLDPEKVAARYFLSRKACDGLILRAGRRKNAVPEELRLALAEQAARGRHGGRF